MGQGWSYGCAPQGVWSVFLQILIGIRVQGDPREGSLVDCRHIFLRRWEAGLQLSLDAVDRIPVWVQLFGVPMEYWTAEGLSCLASAVGLPLFADGATESCRRISYARICVELNAKLPLVIEFVADTYNSSEGQISGTAKIKPASAPPDKENAKNAEWRPVQQRGRRGRGGREIGRAHV